MINKSFLTCDDLQNGLHLWQDKNSFRFGLDAVLLSDFASGMIKQNNPLIYDFCCGNGIIPLLLCSRIDSAKIVGVEINEEAASLARFNILDNGLNDKVSIITSDVKKLDESLNGSVKYITVNPPYIKIGSGIEATDEARLMARHEKYLSLSELAQSIYRLLSDKGSVFMIHRTSRLAEIISVFQAHRLSIKTLCFIHPTINKKSNLVLIAACKNSGAWSDVLPPVIVYNQDGSYTEQIYKIYGEMKERQ